MFFFQNILPILSVLLMALSYQIPRDSTEIIPLKLDMYRYPKTFYSSYNKTLGQKYEDAVRSFGESAMQTNNVTDGKYILILCRSKKQVI